MTIKCASCKKIITDTAGIVKVEAASGYCSLTVHRACLKVFIDRRNKKRDKMEQSAFNRGIAGSYHGHDGRIIRGTNSC